jgi:hypothetical protein
MSCALTQGHVLACRDSKGGSKEFYIIAKDDLAALTALAGAMTVITKDAAKQFYKYEQEVGVAEADEVITNNRENGTTYVEQSVKLVINKRQTTVRNEIQLLAQNRLVIIEVDNNGEGWLYGFDNGLMMESGSAKSGKGWGDRNGYEFEFKGAQKELAYQVSSTLVATLTTPGV